MNHKQRGYRGGAKGRSGNRGPRREQPATHAQAATPAGTTSSSAGAGRGRGVTTDVRGLPAKGRRTSASADTGAATVPVGTTATVTVERLNDDGEGVAKLAGWTVFVPMALPGETLNVAVTEVYKRHLVAKVVAASALPAADSGSSAFLVSTAFPGSAASNPSEVPNRAAIRTEPPCGIYEACGGCQLQHIRYDAQLGHKRDVVEQAIKRIGKLDNIPVRPTIGMDNPWRYRNQIQVPLRYDAETGTLLPGFFAAKSHDIVPTDSCFLAPEPMEKVLRFATETLTRMLGPDAKFVHHLIIRRSYTTSEQLLVLCLRKDLSGRLQDVAQALMIPPVVGVVYTVQPSPTGPVWGTEVRCLAGKEDLVEQLGTVEFLVSPRSFFQVNTEQAKVLVDFVSRHAGLSGSERVLDAYSGTGTFGLTLAAHAKEVIGVEEVLPAVLDARRNAKHNRIKNARFEVGQTEVLVPEWTKAGERFDFAVLDPPRKGCHKDVLDALVAAEIPRIVYVSCNPATLARDLRILVDANYVIEDVQPVDMFPHTSHIECCTVLTRGD